LVKMGALVLEKLGYAVESSTDPEKALILFRENPHKFDLVITDMTMPHMTGDQLIEEILHIRKDMPIILCTGFSSKINPEKAKQIGVDCYIEKPLIKKDIAKVIREVLDKKKES